MPHSRDYEWTEEHDRLWQELVPRSGRASTLQGELVRLAGKLTDEAYRNGNLNWRVAHEQSWRWIGRHLDDRNTFSDDERAGIRQAIETIIRNRKDPDTSGHGSCYYLISQRVVDWCKDHPDLIPLEPDPTLTL